MQPRCVGMDIFPIQALLLADKSMASSDRMNLENDQEKLEWDALLVSFLRSRVTEGKVSSDLEGGGYSPGGSIEFVPS